MLEASIGCFERGLVLDVLETSVWAAATGLFFDKAGIYGCGVAATVSDVLVDVSIGDSHALAWRTSRTTVHVSRL